MTVLLRLYNSFITIAWINVVLFDSVI